ncbi:TonB-dependent receptor [Xenophilus aerolatus]|nr:TonB-dependent receptor [Xenophilus aerolatus]
MTPRAPFARPLPRASLLSVALASALPVLAIAQTPPSLGETVVTATRVEQPISDLVADVSVIDRATIERSGASGVADLLARLPGVEISRNGNVGNTTSLFIRGAETRFTAVYLDGVRIDSQSTGGAPWESIPLAQIERIEVLRGPAAAVYGSDAIGGVVQLFTKKGEGKPTPFVSWGVGNRRTQDIQTGISGSAGAFDYSVGASYQQSAGFDVRTPNVRHNTDADSYKSISGNVRLGWQIGEKHRVDLTALESEMDSGYDAFLSRPFNPLRGVDDRNQYHLRTAGLTWTAQWTPEYKTRLSVTDSNQRYQTNVKGEQPDYITQTRLRGYLFQNEYRVGSHLFTAALERREDKLFNPALDSYSTTLFRKRSQDALALGYGFVQGPHSLQLNLRHDDDSEFGGKNTGSIAYGYEFVKNWRVTASAGTAFRAPTLYQRFSEYGDANLRPETSRNAEVGLRYGDGTTSASLVAYRNRVRNLITFDYSSTACESLFGCYANVNRARYEGVTLAASHRLGDVTLRGSLDYQNPRDVETNHMLPLRAQVHGTLGADWRVGGWTLGAELQASGRRWADAANTQRLGGYGIVNLSASGEVARDLTLVARVDNVADKNYQLVKDYATAGRTVYVGLKWSPR